MLGLLYRFRFPISVFVVHCLRPRTLCYCRFVLLRFLSIGVLLHRSQQYCVFKLPTGLRFTKYECGLHCVWPGKVQRGFDDVPRLCAGQLFHGAEQYGLSRLPRKLVLVSRGIGMQCVRSRECCRSRIFELRELLRGLFCIWVRQQQDDVRGLRTRYLLRTWFHDLYGLSFRHLLQSHSDCGVHAVRTGKLRALARPYHTVLTMCHWNVL